MYEGFEGCMVDALDAMVPIREGTNFGDAEYNVRVRGQKVHVVISLYLYYFLD